MRRLSVSRWHSSSPLSKPKITFREARSKITMRNISNFQIKLQSLLENTLKFSFQRDAKSQRVPFNNNFWMPKVVAKSGQLKDMFLQGTRCKLYIQTKSILQLHNKKFIV